MNLTVDELKENYDKLITFINDNFSGERKDKLLQLYDELGERIILAPASSYNYFHNAFPGGLVLHVLNVISAAQNIYKLWKHHGSDVSGYTYEELMFSALNHDLGKIGSVDEDFYIANESQWHIKNQGKYYELNPNIQNIKHPDRSLFLLQHYGIKYSEQEMLAIQLHDGPFDKGNDHYFNTFSEAKMQKTNIVFILHQADYMSYRIEYEQWRKTKKSKNYNPLKKPTEKTSLGAEEKFDKLFKEK